MFKHTKLQESGWVTNLFTFFMFMILNEQRYGLITKATCYLSNSLPFHTYILLYTLSDQTENVF